MVTTDKTKQPAKKKTASERKAFKDWFDKSAADSLSVQIASVNSQFESARFKRLALRKIETLEFNDRVKQFSDALQKTLPGSYPQALEILVQSLPEPASANSITEGWLQWPLGQFIADYGTGHFQESMHAMTELTQRFSSEFAIRPFVEKYPQQTFTELHKLTGHNSEHVRRWCSEGIRTRLPWGRVLKDLIAEPAPVFSILEQLLDDDSVYVRKSVANNLNDLSKDHPVLVLKKCRQWQQKDNPGRDWIIRHALRGLIKQGNPDALELIGYSKPDNLKVQFSITPEIITVGQSVELQATIKNSGKHSQNLMVDYVVHFVRQKNVINGKVFKWKSFELGAGESATIVKLHPMKETTIRALYSGVHKVELQVNGIRIAERCFVLE